MTRFAAFCCQIVGRIGQEDLAVNGMAPVVIFIAVTTDARVLTKVGPLTRTRFLRYSSNGI